jgi:acyl-CoA thioester hydrolase
MADRSFVTRDDFFHWTPFEVRWGEIDGYGHLNNVAYFSYFEAARVRYMLDIGKYDALMGESALQVIVNCTMNFRREVRFPATLDVGVGVSKVGRTSYTVKCAMFLAGASECVADGEGTIVTLDPAQKKPMSLPDDLVAAFERREQRSLR